MLEVGQLLRNGCCFEFCRLKIFIPLMILSMAILVPVNVGAGSLAESGTDVTSNTTDTKFLFSSIDKLSMSNVPNRSPRWLQREIHLFLKGLLETNCEQEDAKFC